MPGKDLEKPDLAVAQFERRAPVTERAGQRVEDRLAQFDLVAGILGVTAEERVPAYDAAPTFSEQGIETVFVNRRGFFAAPGTSEERVAQEISAFEAMYETEAWEEVRSRNGWVNIRNPGDDFRAFLEAQEKEIGDLMQTLGFLQGTVPDARPVRRGTCVAPDLRRPHLMQAAPRGPFS